MTSIRKQLTRDLLAAGFVLFGAGWLAFFLIARNELIEQFDDALRSKALAVAASSPAAAGRLESSGELSRNSEHEAVSDYFELWSGDGHVLGRSGSLGIANLPSEPGRRRHIWNLALPDGRSGRALFLDLPGGEHLVIASARDELDEALNKIYTSAVVGGLALGGLILVGVPRVLRRGLVPLALVGEAVGGMHAESLSDRLPFEQMPAELQPIVARLNQLFARLELAFDRERRFSADLAHELRTPIAELRSAAECALKWPDTRDPGQDREVLAIAVQMEVLVTRLLTLARGEQNRLAAQVAELDLASQVAAAWAPFADRASRRRLSVRLQVPAGPVLADPALLRSVLTNLFDNATDYTPDGGDVVVKVERAGGLDRLEVANSIQGLGAADVDRLFDRLWRKDAARSGGRHLGLGLPLARTFANAMGLGLTAVLAPAGDRLVFALTLPVNRGREVPAVEAVAAL